MPAESSWTFSGPIAELRSDGVSGQVDVSRPDLGLHGVAIESQAASLLKVRREETDSRGQLVHTSQAAWPLNVADAYVRGRDLVATYQPTETWPYAPQIYWRSEEGFTDVDLAVPGSLSLIVSVQTHLLDTRPRIIVSSDLKCDELLQLSPQSTSQEVSRLGPGTIQPSGDLCCIVRRLADSQFSYAEMMPASDFHELRVSQDGAGRWQAEWELFSEFLEKGVIRRARIDGYLLPRERDLELAAICCTRALQMPLPLTT